MVLKALDNSAEGVGGGASLFSLILRLCNLWRPPVMAATSSHVDSKLRDKFNSCRPEERDLC